MTIEIANEIKLDSTKSPVQRSILLEIKFETARRALLEFLNYFRFIIFFTVVFDYDFY